ncbi:MAG: type II toxin-antitoxin system PemK/MazF family toxin [Bifidobacteriaceae bacterium]|jgi:mRNA-degrading endonuclease toxin of MazEF toxin-antitoxin module|nr:type II toxin-antitoxin system PemK/MazF family toxin [Bifidobacteriaceae bacterium]
MHWADLDPSRGREQVRTIARERLVGEAGWVDRETMEEVSLWLRDFLSLP